LGFPLIRLFSTPNNYYFFDTNRNEMKGISESTYFWLQNCIEQNNDISLYTDIPDEIIALQHDDFLSDNQVNEIYHSLTDDVEVILERRLLKIVLQLTQSCNFRCAYCTYTANNDSQRLHSTKSMSWKTIKEALLFLLNHSIDSPEVQVGFYGGEPLLAYDMLKKTVAYAEKLFYGKKITFTISTNGDLLNREIMNYLIAHDFQILISIDGCKEIHNKNRVFASDGSGTFDSVITGITNIQDNNPEFVKHLTLNMVLDPSVDFDNFDCLFREYPGLNLINVTSSLIDDTQIDIKNIYSNEYDKKVKYQQFLVYMCAYGRVPVEYISKPMQGNVNRVLRLGKHFIPSLRLPERAAPSGPCLPGEDRLMCTVEGLLIACERVSEISECMIVGNIEKGINYNKIKALLNVANISEEQCKKCWAFNLCDQCGKQADMEGRLDSETRLKFCESTYKMAEQILKEKAMADELQLSYGLGGLF